MLGHPMEKIVAVRPPNTPLTPHQVLASCMNDVDSIEDVVVMIRRKKVDGSDTSATEIRSSNISVESATFMLKLFERNISKSIDQLLR